MATTFTEHDLKKYVAEFLGTFFLTFAGMSAMLGNGDLVTIAAAHGGTLALMVYLFGPVSGAHVNPAVSIGLFLQRKMVPKDLVGYLVFQVVGATLAALLAANMYPVSAVGLNAARQGATLGVLTQAPAATFYSPGAALFLEILLTFLLVSAVSLVVAGGEKMALASGAIIGGTLFVAILFGGPFTGASLNPARSIGPAIASGTDSIVWGSLWVYVLGPALGGAIAAFVFMWFRGDLKIHFASSAAVMPPQPAALPPQPTTPPLPAPTIPQSPPPPPPGT